MMFKKNKTGQAAIEFLMTYGWMLLVVLIVGALIFSFVDFGSLLPNKVELNNNLRASQTESFASVNSGDSYVTVPFTYSGSKKIQISVDPNSKIKSDVGSDSCVLVWIKNVNTDAATTAATTDLVIGGTTLIGYQAATFVTDVIFISGQTGVAVYDCSSMNSNAGLLLNDVLEGKISLYFQNVQTKIPTPSSGPFRISITE